MDERSHIPIGSDIELQSAIDEGSGGGAVAPLSLKQPDGASVNDAVLELNGSDDDHLSDLLHAFGGDLGNSAEFQITKNGAVIVIANTDRIAGSGVVFQVMNGDGQVFFKVKGDGTVHIKTGGSIVADL